ncbi:hypothetical protein P171DRAFT_467855 [Karstenula rhodostoma CBS 690.94]|uniref:Uncharacterized protein n=1 Tax=Karstenula rhodostoma CBS 690.94 TaxID=1392251 RepID=A0A9P4PVJ8_9PLEO|nr:hypothetical protein P171DRAFT_467855 [Karstenula rhodostoma CBS 690.94]
MGGSIGSSGNFSRVGEFVKDVVYHAQRYSGATRAERRKQTFEYRLRKLRLRERREHKWQGGHLQAPTRLQDAVLYAWWGAINLKWKFDAFREDMGMRALLKEEQAKGDMPNTSSGLFVQEFQNSPNALDTHIHRVFRPSNFQNPMLQPRLPDGRRHQAWVNMRPALILATKFLLDPQFGAFWNHLMYGTPVTDAATRRSYLEHSDLENDLKTARADFEALLGSLADRVTFYWRPEKSEGSTLGAIFRMSFWEVLEEFIDVSRFQHLKKPAEGYNGFIGLSSKFLYNLMSENAVTYTDVDADIRFQFLLAVTLTHELAHAIYAWRGLPHVGWANGLTEVFAFDTDISNEIGWSWENHTWDGVVLTCTLDHDAIGDVVARTWESEVFGETYMYTPTPEAWLKSLFMKDSWKDIIRVIKQVPKPVGRPHLFFAQRWIDNQRGFEYVEYVDGHAVRPEHRVLNDREGPVRGDVDGWFKRVRRDDLRKAVRTRLFVTERQLGPRFEILGKAIAVAPLDEEMLEAEEESDGEAEGDDDDGDAVYESSDDGFVNGEDPPEEHDMEFDLLAPSSYRSPGLPPPYRELCLPRGAPRSPGFHPPNRCLPSSGVLPPDRGRR